jgi:hypothetical protein
LERKAKGRVVIEIGIPYQAIDPEGDTGKMGRKGRMSGDIYQSFYARIGEQETPTREVFACEKLSRKSMHDFGDQAQVLQIC